MRIEDPRDSEKRYFRSGDRLISLNGEWYFTTREGDVGPYCSRDEAQEALEFFISEKSDLYTFQKSREAYASQVNDAQRAYGSFGALPMAQVSEVFL